VSNATGIISNFAGSDGYNGAYGEGILAVDASLNNPRGLAFVGDSDEGYLFIADTDHHAVRVVQCSSGLITTFAGTLGVPGASGDGGLAREATLNHPWGVAVDLNTGDVFIADTDSRVIRSVNIVSGIISTFAGTLGVAGFSGDGGLAASALLLEPTGVAVSPSGAVYIADLSANAIREVPRNAPTVCPAGFFCSIGSNLVPCLDPTTFCPQNSAAPLRVGTGYYSSQAPNPFEPGQLIYPSQKRCPLGSFCPPGLGKAIPCYAGTFGVAIMSTDPQQCSSCDASSYNAERGKYLTTARDSAPCLACPLGTASHLTGSAFCAFCPPLTFRSFNERWMCALPAPHAFSVGRARVLCSPRWRQPR
jgi:DNA-binding beta-propeller fold protein YncE